MRSRRSKPIEDQPSPSASEADDTYDPYAELENVFDEPIVLEEADIQGLEVEDQPEAEAEAGEGPATEKPAGSPASESGNPELWARFMALEAEVRSGSERTLEALRRLGERVGSELAMLDKRAINLELTLARLRSMIEASQPGARRPPEPPVETEPPGDS
jgi:hypothetical protein